MPGPGPLRDALASVATVARNPGLRALNAGWAGSITGEYLTLTALGVYGFGASGATGVGLIAVAQMLPALIIGPFAALLGDRFPRERVLAGTEVVRALASLLAAVAVAGGAGAWVVFVIAGILGASRTAYYPAQSALIPLLARHPHEITASAASLNLIKNVANLAAPALAGVLLLFLPLSSVFEVGAAAFLVSGAVAALRLPATAELRAHVRRGNRRREVSRGFRAARREPAVRTPLALCAAQGVGRGAINVLVILLPLGLLGLGDSGAGFYSALIGLGGILGVLGSLSLLGRRALAVPMALGLIAMGAPYGLPALVPAAAAAAVALLAAGTGNAVMGVTGMSLLVRESRDDVLSRVMGVQEIVRAAGIIVASIGLPLLSEAIGLRAAVVVLGAGLTAWGLAALPGARRLDAAAREPSPETALLADSPLFRRLLPVALDRVSRRMTREPVEAGRELIREGEAGDRVYLVTAGRFAVSAAGRPLAVLGRGDVVGEIALLGDGVRTATVRCLDPGEVLWLDRSEFLSAVLGHPFASTDARALAGARLARGASITLEDASSAP